MALDNPDPAKNGSIPTDTARASIGEGRKGNSFPVVGIDASAGGLEAFTQLLAHLPQQTGLAFVLIPHLDPTHENQLISPNHVYAIPPNTNMAIARGILLLTTIGVLSGTGSDGSAGLAEIKAASGITFAQDEDSPEYPSMPQRASLCVASERKDT